MQNQYITLENLAHIVEDAVHPTQFAVTTREMILHSQVDWELIFLHLKELSKEGLVTIVPADTIQVYITQRGMERVQRSMSKCA